MTNGLESEATYKADFVVFKIWRIEGDQSAWLQVRKKIVHAPRGGLYLRTEANSAILLASWYHK